MITNKTFQKEIPSTDGTIFEFAGGSGLDSALTMVLENQSSVNSLTYKIQTSADGATWTDLTLPASPSPAVSFVVGPNSAHTVKLANTSQWYRLVARGSMTALIGLVWQTYVDPSSGTVPRLIG